jgi:hypothetical protein
MEIIQMQRVLGAQFPDHPRSGRRLQIFTDFFSFLFGYQTGKYSFIPPRLYMSCLVFLIAQHKLTFWYPNK